VTHNQPSFHNICCVLLCVLVVDEKRNLIFLKNKSCIYKKTKNKKNASMKFYFALSLYTSALFINVSIKRKYTVFHTDRCFEFIQLSTKEYRI